MLTVRFLYDSPGWAFHNHGVALQRYSPSDFQVTLGGYLLDEDLDEALGTTQPDIVVLNRFTSTRKVREALDARGWTSKLVVFWNNGWPRRIEFLGPVLLQSDFLVFVNHTYWQNVGRPVRTACIPHGVDLDIFANKIPLEDRPRRVLWMGSEINRAIKGYDEIANPVKLYLAEQGFESDFRLVDSFANDKLSREEMADWYNTGRAFLCTSHTEGTPNVALEAAACGCALITTPVGNMPELIRHGENGVLVEATAKAFMRAVRDSEPSWPQMAKLLEKDIQDWGRERRAGEFYALLRKVVESDSRVSAASAADGILHANGHAHHPPGIFDKSDLEKPDFSDDLTVFVSTVGSPTFDLCVRLLEEQDCTFRLRIVENVAPMSAAFQKMLDDCETPFYVQVDEDMLLYSHAVRTLFERMNEQEPHLAIYGETLFDTQVRKNIHAVKIFRHAIVRKYSFRDVESCEVDQILRLQKDGYDYLVKPPRVWDDTVRGSLGLNGASNDPFNDTLGLHGTNYTKETAYLRYLTLQRRQRRKWTRGWSALLPELVEVYRKEPSEVNLYAVFGALAGNMIEITHRETEKDYRKYKETPGLAELSQFFDAVNRRGPRHRN